MGKDNTDTRVTNARIIASAISAILNNPQTPAALYNSVADFKADIARAPDVESIERDLLLHAVANIPDVFPAAGSTASPAGASASPQERLDDIVETRARHLSAVLAFFEEGPPALVSVVRDAVYASAGVAGVAVKGDDAYTVEKALFLLETQPVPAFNSEAPDCCSAGRTKTDRAPLSRADVQKLVGIISASGDEPENKSAALVVLMDGISDNVDIATDAKLLAFGRCAQLDSLKTTVDDQVKLFRGKLSQSSRLDD